MEPQDRDADRDREREESRPADDRREHLVGHEVREEDTDERGEHPERDPLDLLAFDPAGSAEPDEDRRERDRPGAEVQDREDGVGDRDSPERLHVQGVVELDRIARRGHLGRPECEHDEQHAHHRHDPPEERLPPWRGQVTVGEQQGQQEEDREDPEQPPEPGHQADHLGRGTGSATFDQPRADLSGHERGRRREAPQSTQPLLDASLALVQHLEDGLVRDETQQTSAGR